MEKLLILSDIHYPICSMSTISDIIAREKPDKLAMLGDNVEPSASSMPVMELYKEFMDKLGAIFPIEKTIFMLGDNDYLLHQQRNEILLYADSVHSLNRSHVLFRKGNMVFSHGNIERSRHLEKVGYHLVRASGHASLIPVIVSALARISLHAHKGDYLFIGHIHLLRKMKNNVTFCGTLNGKAKFFGDDSMGYVVVMHDNFILGSEDDIKAVSISAPASKG